MANDNTKLKKIDYETCPVKHYVRVKGWMADCNWQNKKVQAQIKLGQRKQLFTYFTFCASQAVDVYMLEMYKLLKRDENGKLNNVYFCEINNEEFEKINSQIRSDNAGFFGDFQKILLFQDNEQTVGKVEFSDSDDTSDEALREKFRIKDLHIRFKNLFPIDVVNLDVYGVFFPRYTDKYSPMLASLNRIFEFQNQRNVGDGHQINSFALILNTHLEFGQYHKESIEHLIEISSENFNSYEAYKEEFLNKFSEEPSLEIAEKFFPNFFSITLPKVLFPLALNNGWIANKHTIYIYERSMDNGKKYHFMSSAIRYTRIDGIAELPKFGAKPYADEYEIEMCRLLKDEPLYVDDHFKNEPEAMQESEAKLKAVVDFKKEILNKYEIQFDA